MFGRVNLLLWKHIQIFVGEVIDRIMILRPNWFSFSGTSWWLLNLAFTVLSDHITPYILEMASLKWRILLIKEMWALLLYLSSLKIVLAMCFNQSLLTLTMWRCLILTLYVQKCALILGKLKYFSYIDFFLRTQLKASSTHNSSQNRESNLRTSLCLL